MDDERPRTLKKKKKKVRRAAAAAEPMSAPTRKVRARPARSTMAPASQCASRSEVVARVRMPSATAPSKMRSSQAARKQ